MLAIGIVCETAVNMIISIITSSSRSRRRSSLCRRRYRRRCRRLSSALLMTIRTILHYSPPMLTSAVNRVVTILNYRTLAPVKLPLRLSRHLPSTSILFHDLPSLPISHHSVWGVRRRGSFQLVVDLLETRQPILIYIVKMSLTSPQQVRNKLATTQHNRHNRLLPAPTCYNTCYGDTGVIDFGL